MTGESIMTGEANLHVRRAKCCPIAQDPGQDMPGLGIELLIPFGCSSRSSCVCVATALRKSVQESDWSAYLLGHESLQPLRFHVGI